MACGSPLESAPEGGVLARHTEGRGGWYAWLGLCLALGAVLGLVLVRVRSPGPATATSYLSSVLFGAIVGGGLGVLPGPALRTFRQAWAAVMCCVLGWVSARTLSRIRISCEEALESDAGDKDANLRLAGVLWLQGARGQVEQVLQRLLDSAGESPTVHHNFAVALAASGRRARALEEFERIRSRMSDSAVLLWNLGLAYWGLGQLAAAGEAFRAATELDPTDLPARNALALALARQGEVDKAIAELELALAAGRRSPQVLCNLGVIHQSRGDLEVASRYFTGALRRNPSHIAARYNRGLCAALKGRPRAAIEDFSALARVDPDHAWGLIQRAIAWHRLGNRRRALEPARRAAVVSRGDFYVLYNAGTIMLRKELVDQAVTELERAYEINPQSIEVILNLGVAVYLGGRPRQALDHFRAAVRLSPRHALARYNCAIAYCMADMLDEAEREADELLTLYPDFPDVFNVIGVIRLFQSRLVEAAEQFRRTADLMPRSAVVRSNLALTYYLEGDLAAAAEQAHYATTLDLHLPAARDVAGHAALEMDDLSLATEHFAALARLEPANPDAHTNLGLAYYKDERLNESIECYERVLIFAPKSPEGHNDLGLAYAKNQMLDEAANHLKQVLEWRPDDPIVHGNLGLVCYFNGDTEDAVHEWREVTRLAPAYARLREATRFSAYDDQGMVMRPIDRRARATQFPPKVAAFRHSFQIALDERAYRVALPWPDLAAAAVWCERFRRARAAVGSS